MAEKTGKKCFVWTDEENALLLKITLDYKSSKMSEGQDWETVRSKYEEIHKMFIAAYPDGEEEGGVEFPRVETKHELTKERITQKLKKLKNNFRKAVDSGRKSGGGRVVCTLYDECYEIWGGSPAAESIAGGIETDLINNEKELMPTASDDGYEGNEDYGAEDTSLETLDMQMPQEDYEPLKKKVKTKREALSASLKERRNSKLVKHASFQEQILTITKEDSQLKKEDIELRRQLVNQFQESEKNFNETMQKFSESISNTMSQGFMMMQFMMQQQMQKGPTFGQQGNGNASYPGNHFQWEANSGFGPYRNATQSEYTDLLNDKNNQL